MWDPELGEIEGHAIGPPIKLGRFYTHVTSPLEERPPRRTGVEEGPRKAEEGEKSHGEITRFRSSLGHSNENQRRG